MTSNPAMTHPERARATLKMLFPKGSPFAQAEQAEKLAVEFALVADEALERAAQWHVDRGEKARALGDYLNCRAHHTWANHIRSLKVSPSNKEAPHER